MNEVLVQVLLVTVPLGVAVIAYWQATKAARITAEVERSKVDAHAYERAKSIYEAALTQLESQLERVQRQFDRLNDLLAREQDTSAALRGQVQELQGQVRHLEEMVAELRKQQRAAGISPKLKEE